MAAYPGFVGGSDVSQSSLANGAKTVNWYVERMQSQDATVKLALYPTPGVETLDTAAAGPGRAHFFEDGREFAVIGSSFGSIDANGLFTAIGTVAVDANPATISTNGDGGGQIFVTSGDNGYIYDVTAATFVQVRTGATTMGAHVDGYFLALDAATSTVFRSALLDGTSWDATHFHQRSIGSDPWISMKVFGRFVWHFGTKTSEVWYNQGSLNNPFAPHPSGFQQHGIAAAFSPTVVSGSLMWLAATEQGHGAIMQASGFAPQAVSTFAIHADMDAHAQLSDAIGDTYEDLGHSFYLLTIPGVSETHCYDATETLQVPQSMRWTERGTWVSEQNQYTAWRPLFHVFAHNEHRMLDRSSGAIYRMGSDLGLDADARPIRRLRRPSALFQENRRIFVPEFEVFVEPGLGLVSGQGSDPQMLLRTSRDGGKTWSNERSRSAGVLGQYDTRMIWSRCGSGRRWMPELVVSDPIQWRVLGARIARPNEQRNAA